ncbi:DUF4012 domain-containing protein [Nocardioides dongxiaopingii]|uniref:DUF4012 domain-containing protein n=1 Tax=Nocardioides sp. S-1144 TaxID=2582905 RepID=UPI0011637114|nr:DUF4012 domain-containing protein [Nocardioides sp. S-1144]QCW50998.2 DUF4012 domain-containing protein [Nocardioides sp. S-1144]
MAAAIIAVVGYTAWQTYQVQQDLGDAEGAVSELRRALNDDDAPARDRAIAALQDAASSAEDRTDGAWWGVMTHVPLVGDDADGVRVLSRTLSSVATDAIAPIASTVDSLDRIYQGGRIDLAGVESMQEPVARASKALTAAATEVEAVDSSGFVGVLDRRFDDYADQLGRAAVSLRSADTAVRVLPRMVGAEGPRDYLLLFQNNAEIRATGGMPGAWALIHAEDGRIDMARQGVALDFPTADTPVVPLTPEEVEVYGKEIGVFFQNPGFAPDFPRAARIWDAHWDNRFPDVDLDGVMALDPVGMSYLLEGTGPVTVDGRSLTSENLVEELLSRPYLELEPEEQDLFFGGAARAIFDAAATDVPSPVSLVDGFERAAREGRFLVATFDEEDQALLADSRVLGELTGDDGQTPHVDVGLNDATGSKMSYYLRYRVAVESRSCNDDRQQLAAKMTLNQVISATDAAELPVSVTGGGIRGVDAGSQVVPIRIYGPAGGTIGDITLNGRKVDPFEQDVRVKNRQVVTIVTELSTLDDAVLNWTMESGPGQVGDGELGVTPSVVPGTSSGSYGSSCP